MRARYRKLMSMHEARDLLLHRLGPVGTMKAEQVPVEQSSGRITAQPVFAAISSPPYHAAAMDGIAVRAIATAGACSTKPVVLDEPDDAVAIDTGDPMPTDKDAVIPVEDIDSVEGGFEIHQAATPRQHVRLTGEDMVAGEMILASGRTIQPSHVGAMLGASVTEIMVRCRPKVAILPTGDELCEPGDYPTSGKVIESNSRMLSAYVNQWGGRPVRLEPVRDEPELLKKSILDALEEGCDVLCILAGSSAGRDDYTPGLISDLGELLFHGLTMMPGKPTAAGIIEGRPVIGIPGFPVSAALAADLLLRPVLAHLLGRADMVPERIQATLSRSVPSRPGLVEWIRVVLGKFEHGWTASSLSRGAGAITTLCRAHGKIAVPAASEGLAAGTKVDVELLVPRAEIEGSLLLSGSSDLALTVLDDFLGKAHPGASLSVSPLGSLAGLAALARGEAHLAGSHLLDPATGTYNQVDVSRVMPGHQVALVTMAYRQQGLCLRPDEERQPEDLADVLSMGMSWVNRQPGSGTRVLTDHLLRSRGISFNGVQGWEHEEFTHVAVAEAVRSGVADCGMLILAAARALGLRFVPLVEEKYDLVIPRRMLDDPRILELLRVLKSAEFKRGMESLGGYDARDTGKVRFLPEGTWSVEI